MLTQATGEPLVDLPDEPDLVLRFIAAAERVAPWVAAPRADPVRRERLERHAREAVEAELRGCRARSARLEAWLQERGLEPDHLAPPRA